jgi:regulator of sigma D
MSLVKNAITRQDWENPSSLRDRILKLQIAIRERAKKLSNDEQISLNQFREISNECQKILDFVAEINSRQFNQVLTDMDEAVKKITEATSSLDQAAAKIQETQNFFDILSGLIRLGEVISNAIVNAGVATIGTVVRELRDIGDQLNT